MSSYFLLLQRIYGTFGCDTFTPQNAHVYLKIGYTVFANSYLTFNLPCFCGNCVSEETIISSSPFCDNNPSYAYGGTNSFQIIVDVNSICLSEVLLVFTYTLGMNVRFISDLLLNSKIQQRLFWALLPQH